MVELIKDRYKLLDPRDVAEFGNYYPGYPKSWGIYYKKIYCHINEWKAGYMLTVWHGKKLDFYTENGEELSLDGLLNILDRYLPKKENEQLSLF